MQELKETIESYAERTSHDGDLRGAAKKWAAFALDTYTGELLHRALHISAALAEFETELEAHPDE